MDPLYLYLDSTEEFYSLGLSSCDEEKQPAPEKQECDCFDVEQQDLLREWRYLVDS